MVDPIFVYLRDLTVVFILVSTLSHFYLRRLNTYIARLANELDERTRTEETLRKQKENYRILFEQASEGILITNAEGVIVMANEGMEHLTGYKQGELLDRPMRFIFASPEEFRYPSCMAQNKDQRVATRKTLLLGSYNFV